jgi:hypothetical protein
MAAPALLFGTPCCSTREAKRETAGTPYLRLLWYYGEYQPGLGPHRSSRRAEREREVDALRPG